MSGSNFTVNCPVCGAVNELRGKAMTLALTCQKCQNYFCTGNWNKATVEFAIEAPIALPIASRGRIDGYVYEVMGFTIKQENKYHYKWREYLLFNPFRGYAFLSEYDGHWTFVWPIEECPVVNKSDTDIRFEDDHYQLYQKYNARVVYAKGEFFFDVFALTSTATNLEYIAPPYLLALEKSDDSYLWCKGEYFTPAQVAEAFSIPRNKLPRTEGIGYTQPFHSPFSHSSLVAFTVLILLLTLGFHVFMNNTAENKAVFHAEYTQEELKDQKMIATSSFDLTDGTKNLVVYISAPVDNDWFFSEFTLVNERDGTEYNFAHEIEYYHGYEDGVSWTEGSRNGEAFLSQIPEGRYHFNIYPEFSFANHSFSVVVTRDVPMQVNLFIAAVALITYPLFFFLRNRHREKKRWSDSEYSPYDYE
jgi:hypothetical protein